MEARLVHLAIVLVLVSCLHASDLPAEKKVNQKIVGGTDAEPQSAPFIVTIALKGRQKHKQLCAGSIVANQWILTAAHCLKNPPYRLIITAGLHNIEDSLDTAVAQVRRCDYYHRHSNYSTIFGATGGWDIGVAHITEPFEFTQFIQPISIHRQADLNGMVMIFGWGSTTTPNGGDYPNALQNAELSIVDQKHCESVRGTSLQAGNFCAGENGKGACLGDSGGPIVQNNTLVGVVSWGPPTCDPKTGPTILTNVGYYYRWISEKINIGIDDNNLIK